jgi:REP element-mobilizing transposase RayT
MADGTGVTLPRPVVAGRTYLLTRRCTQRQFLLRPDDEVRQIYEYCLAEAAARFQITLFAWVAMSNHQHIVARDNLANLPEFVAHLNKMTAKALNAYWGRRENLWATEQPNNVWLVDKGATFGKLIYVLANPVAEDLVDSVSEWPGASSLALCLSGATRTVERPRCFFSERGVMPDVVPLRAERLPGFEHLTLATWSERVLAALHTAEARARKRRAETGKRVLGRRAILRALPTDRASTNEPLRSLKPRLACRDRARMVGALEGLRGFWEAYRSALERLKARRPAMFPAGTYRARRFGARCADEPPVALATNARGAAAGTA